MFRRRLSRWIEAPYSMDSHQCSFGLHLPHANSFHTECPSPTLWSQLSCHLPQRTCSSHGSTLQLYRSCSLHLGLFSTPCRLHVTYPSRSPAGVCSVTGLTGVENKEFRSGCFCSWLHTLACLLLALCQGQSSPGSPQTPSFTHHKCQASEVLSRRHMAPVFSQQWGVHCEQLTSARV